MPSIQTEKDWWNVLNENIVDIKALFLMFLPPSRRHKASERDFALSEKDYKVILSDLNEVWSRAPDKPHIHSIPGWAVLCDLCSENWVFSDLEKKDE